MSKNYSVAEFMSAMQLNFGEPKDEGIYFDRLVQFKPWELGKIFDNITETYDRQGFPRLAAILSSARSLGLPKQEHAEHSTDWTPTSCRLCGGSGMVASIWETSVRESASGDYMVDVRDRIHFGPYQESAPYLVGILTRTVSRCTCGSNMKCVSGLPMFDIGQDKTEKAIRKRPNDGRNVTELRQEFRAMFDTALKKKTNQAPREFRRIPREPGDED